MDLRIDATSTVPPYEQLRTQVASAVAAGRLPAGSKLPTVRQTATDLGLSVNTVARAYRGLEADGVVETHGRRGTFVGSAALASGDTADLATSYVVQARRAGLTLAEATRLVEQAWAR